MNEIRPSVGALRRVVPQTLVFDFALVNELEIESIVLEEPLS